jgi:hypothetical protein
MMLISPAARRRFWKKVRVDTITGCWIWKASVRRWSREPWDGGYMAASESASGSSVLTSSLTGSSSDLSSAGRSSCTSATTGDA